jgi:hypothetical protein
MVDKVALGQVFSEYFGFPCESSFHQFFHNHHDLSSGTGAIGQQVAAVPKVPPRNLKKAPERMALACAVGVNFSCFCETEGLYRGFISSSAEAVLCIFTIRLYSISYYLYKINQSELNTEFFI